MACYMSVLVAFRSCFISQLDDLSEKFTLITIRDILDSQWKVLSVTDPIRVLWVFLRNIFYFSTRRYHDCEVSLMVL